MVAFWESPMLRQSARDNGRVIQAGALVLVSAFWARTVQLRMQAMSQ